MEEHTLFEVFTIVVCVLYGFLKGYLVSELLFAGQINAMVVAAFMLLGYAVGTLIVRS